jgi:hypothetical protein
MSDTPEAHHDRLMTEINYELDTYGPHSLADMIASIIDARIGDEDEPASNYHTAEGEYWRTCRRAFEDLAYHLPAKPRN